MDWMRENLKTVVLLTIAAIGIPYLLSLFGLIRF